MKGLVIIVIIGGLVYGGWTLYQQSISSNKSLKNATNNVNLPNLALQNKDQSFTHLQSVLGASISNGVSLVTDKLSDVTGGASEPIINHAISNFQQELSKLPEDQMKKIQYNYCKSIVTDYEKQNNYNSVRGHYDY